MAILIYINLVKLVKVNFIQLIVWNKNEFYLILSSLQKVKSPSNVQVI